MTQQIALAPRNGALLAEDSTARDTASVVNDINDVLTVIRAYANRGGDISYDAERTERYFGLIEAAAKTAAQITRQLLVVDPARPMADGLANTVARPTEPHEIAASTNREAGSSFRRRLRSARALAAKTGFPGTRR